MRVVTSHSAQPFTRAATERSLTGPTPFIIVVAATHAEVIAAAQESSIGITLFAPEGAGLWVTPLGEEPLAVIVNKGDQIDDLSLGQLQDIYAGRDPTRAAAIREEGDDSRLFFESAVLRGVRPAATLRLTPSPEAMIKFVGETPNAIGYLPLRWVNDSVKMVKVDGNAPGDEGYALTALTVAIAKTEPGGPARDWLGKVQSAENR